MSAIEWRLGSGSGQPTCVLGGKGMLGQALVRALEERDAAFDAPPRSRLDLEESGGIEAYLDVARPAGVINAAGYTDVRGAATAPGSDRARRLNGEVPERLARVCADRGIGLVHVSTDYVFDGRKGRPYLETDPTGPLQEYGRSKLVGERAVLEQEPAALVVRVSTLFGPGHRERPHFVDAVVRRMGEQGRLGVPRVPVSAVGYCPHLAEGLLDLISAGACGIVHLVNSGSCSRLELAREAVRLAGFDPRNVSECEPPADGVRRPEYSVLDTTRLATLIGRPLPSWRRALADYLGEVAS